VLARLHAAWAAGDSEAVMRWNSFLIACRETEELRAEDRHLGAALFRVLSELELKTGLFPLDPPRSPSKAQQGVAHATAFAFACASWGVDAGSAMQTYAWAWIENQVLAAVKLVPLGQSAAQRMLHALASRIPRSVERAHKLTDSDIGVSTALSAVASGRHEAQYSRLFRS
jgi:urease accessory protein